MNETKQIATEQQNWYKDLSDKAAANKHIIHEYFDLDYTKAMIRHVIRYLENYYFRPQFIGFDDFPKRNNPDVPTIFASNHSGMAFPWDGIILAAGMYEMFDYGSEAIRPLASPMLSESVLMNPYLYDNIWPFSY